MLLSCYRLIDAALIGNFSIIPSCLRIILRLTSTLIKIEKPIKGFEGIFKAFYTIVYLDSPSP